MHCSNDCYFFTHRYILRLLLLQNCTVQSTTAILCYTVPGIGAGLSWVLTYNGASLFMASSVTAFSTSYNAPVILAVSAPSSVGYDTVGGDIMIISGELLLVLLFAYVYVYSLHRCPLCFVQGLSLDRHVLG